MPPEVVFNPKNTAKMEAIRKKLTSLRSTLESTEERYEKTKQEIATSKEKAEEVDAEICKLKEQMICMEKELEEDQTTIEVLSMRLEEVIFLS